MYFVILRNDEALILPSLCQVTLVNIVNLFSTSTFRTTQAAESVIASLLLLGTVRFLSGANLKSENVVFSPTFFHLRIIGIDHGEQIELVTSRAFT